MKPALRLVTETSSTGGGAGAGAGNDRWQAALRPTSFAEYIGQHAVIANLRLAVDAARHGGWTLDHFLISGPPGTGKTSLAQIVANELGTKLHVASAPSILHKGELATLLASVSEGDVVLIDEIHALPVKMQEVLYTAMEDFSIDLPTAKRGARAITVPLPKFTLLAATTRVGLLSAPLRDRFGFHFVLEHYEVADLATIIARSASLLGVIIDQEGCEEIARRSRGTPRIANRLLRRVRDTATMAPRAGALVPVGRPVPTLVPSVDGPLAAAALGRLGIDAAGLESLDRKYLTALAARGVPVGVAAMAATLATDPGTLEESVEPLLLQLGFIARTERGRIATAAGLAHLTEPEDSENS